MTKFSQAAIAIVTMVGMTGGALAAGDAKTDAKAGAGAKVDVKAGTPTNATTKADAKAGAMEMPKPPQELADMAKMASGTWRCKGQGMGPDMKMGEMSATMKMDVALDKWWMHGSFQAMMGKIPFKFESFTTYDASAKKWHRVMVESGGGYSTGDSAGMTADKVDWDLTTHGPMGDGMFRDHEDMSDKKAGAKMWGEMSMDHGKTWTKVYEMTCKK